MPLRRGRRAATALSGPGMAILALTACGSSPSVRAAPATTSTESPPTSATTSPAGSAPGPSPSTTTSPTAPAATGAPPAGPSTTAPGATPTTTSRGATPTIPAPVTTTTAAPDTATTSTTAGGSAASASGSSGGLSITLTAQPARAPAGTTVTFTIRATETHATGALTYQLAYGDGATDQNTAPTFCQGGPGTTQSQTWQLGHAYSAPGSYTARVTVRANCTSDQATAAVAVTAA